MADFKIDDKTLLRMGLGIGYAFAPFVRGLLRGLEEFEIEEAARDIQEENDAIRQEQADETLKRPADKTRIGDCRKCWCNQCGNIEECESIREGSLPDGIRPFPCVDCADGLRFMPTEEPPCDFFKKGNSVNYG